MFPELCGIFWLCSWEFQLEIELFVTFVRRQDSSIGFGAPVRANMRVGGSVNAAITSSLLESVRMNLLKELV